MLHTTTNATQQSKASRHLGIQSLYLAVILLALLSSLNENVNAQNKSWQQQNICGAIPQVSNSVSKIDTIVNGDSVIIIPTVFHILTQGGAENISKSHIQRALQILNQDFNRQNPDTFDIPAAFHPLRGNPKVEFRLARIDPQGNCTDGIDRIYTPLTGAINNFIQMQPNFSWDHTQYLNIYVVKWLDYQNDPTLIAASYIAPPDSGQNLPPQYDALALGYFTLPDGFNGVAPGFRGHTISHEIGHNLGLFHTWGLAGCSNDDEVTDTPLQDDQNIGCPIFPHITCGNGPNGDMFNNFMDYSECASMFTQGQVDRMRTCLANNEWRETLWTPANLAATGVDTLMPVCSNPPVADFGYGNYAGWLCAGKPVQFYEAATWNPTSYEWQFNGGIPSSSTDTFPSVIFPDSGMYNVTLIVSNSNGTDTISKTIRIEPAEVTYAFSNNSMTESFEDSASNQQIAQWQLVGKKWAVTNLAAYSGNNSIRLDSSLRYFNTFFTHIFDLNQITGAGRKLEFKVACGMTSSGSIAGGLRVTWKRPCAYERFEIIGNTEKNVESGALHPGVALLPGFLQTANTNSVFIPNSSQWKTITLDIPDSLTGEIQIGFNWGSFTVTNKLKGLYIDDITVRMPTGIDENNGSLLWQLFPNPATDLLTITYPSLVGKEVIATITDITGKIIYASTTSSKVKLEVNTSTYAEGVYLVRVQTKDFTETKKVIVVK